MNGGIQYLLGVALGWTGGIALLWAAVRVLQAVLGAATEKPKYVRSAVVALALAGAGLFSSGLVLRHSLLEGTTLKVPLVWVVMAFAAWAALACGVMVGVRLVQAFLALSREEGRRRLTAALCWLAAGACFLIWALRDGTPLEILRGALAMPLSTAVGLLIFALLAGAAVVLSAKRTKTRAGAQGVATHAALVTGSLIFGLPLAFLIVTSFKEDRDMVSKDGKIIWVPKVQREVPYMDPERPTYEGEFQGQRVEGEII